jgi:3-deoxy-D-manno-octulosonate 8-phosphate phosphatase (KDO 8-P phosphatase)
MAWEDIRLVLMDGDGVLTDGTLWLGPNQEEFKRFHVRDGLGIVLLKSNGIETGVISGRYSAALAHRMEELKVTLVYQGVTDKLACYREVLAKCHLEDKQVAYMGDDLPDLPILEVVGLAAAPLDAVPEVMHKVFFRAPYPGGSGAVRALAEFILKSQGKWGY